MGRNYSSLPSFTDCLATTLIISGSFLYVNFLLLREYVQFLRRRQAAVDGDIPQLHIERRRCGLDIRAQEYEADPERQNRQENPAGKGQVEDEHPPFMPVGHRYAELQRPFVSDHGVIGQDIRRHAVRQRFDQG